MRPGKIIHQNLQGVAVNQAEGFLQKSEKTTCGKDPYLSTSSAAASLPKFLTAIYILMLL